MRSRSVSTWKGHAWVARAARARGWSQSSSGARARVRLDGGLLGRGPAPCHVPGQQIASRLGVLQFCLHHLRTCQQGLPPASVANLRALGHSNAGMCTMHRDLSRRCRNSACVERPSSFETHPPIGCANDAPCVTPARGYDDALRVDDGSRACELDPRGIGPADWSGGLVVDPRRIGRGPAE
jgi:hypothetical protein